MSHQDNSDNIFNKTLTRHSEVLEKVKTHLVPDIETGARMIVEALKNHKRLFTCGNGGSAADSQHIAAEWVCKYQSDRDPLPAISLTVDTSALTAIGNDYGFENVFSRQIKALGSPGDVLIAITTSGKSPNILKAIEFAKEKSMKVILLTGESGAHLKNSPLTDLTIVIPSRETARIQEMHELIYHTWCEYADTVI